MHKKLIIFTISLSLLTVLTILGTVHQAKAETVQSENSHIIVAPNENSSVAHGLKERVEASWPWYITRASGIVAAITLVVLMLSGVGLITGHTFEFLEPITAWASHRALGIAFLVSVLLHVGSLYFDNFVPFNIIDLLIPFASNYKPVMLAGISFGSLYIAFGVIALYLVVAIMVTSIFWLESKPKLWNWTHLMSYLAMILVFFHALYLGTDSSTGFGRLVWITAAICVLVASLARLWRAKTV